MQQEAMMYFSKLDDSPMFRQQIQCLEEIAETLRERGSKFYKGCRKYTDGLNEANERDAAFASSLENFGGGPDPISVSVGGPDMIKFAVVLREVGTYKESLRTKVEHTLSDRLLRFTNIELQDIKEARKRFDKADAVYSQIRDKFLSLRKSTRTEIASAMEEELYNARMTFEQARFNLVSALSSVETKKRFEIVESVGEAMEAHLHYFKQGYELLLQMQPYIEQVLLYAQKARQSYYSEQQALNERVQEYKKHIDIGSKISSNISVGNGDMAQQYPRNSHKVIQAVMQSGAEGKVQNIKQGYLSKRSSNLRGDWKRRFFVLDNRGMLFYYRKQLARPSGSGVQRGNTAEPGPGILSRWLSSHYHGGVHDVARHTVNLLTSTIKPDADQSDLRFCFRIISPMKIYTLQAESSLEQMDWIEKINGVIASLLSSHSPEMHLCSPTSEGNIGEGGEDRRASAEWTNEKDRGSRNMMRACKSSQQLRYGYTGARNEKPVDALKKIVGNDKCADCSAPDPDWASLNLGLLICIECSGVHRNLGVHISKVRSLELDVKAWEPSVIKLFQSLGNVFANSVWEKTLTNSESCESLGKPSCDDHISAKEKFIHAKYSEKRYIEKVKDPHHLITLRQQLWENVRANDKKAVYLLLIICNADVNATYGQPQDVTNIDHDHDHENECDYLESYSTDSIKETDDHDPLTSESLDGCSLLHLAAQTADCTMVELLLQHGANINACDSKGQTPLHHGITTGRLAIVKLLLTRGANTLAEDVEGKTPRQLVTELGIDDIEILALLRAPKR